VIILYTYFAAFLSASSLGRNFDDEATVSAANKHRSKQFAFNKSHTPHGPNK